MLKEDQKELDGLIREVMDQMEKRKYGRKIVARYQSSRIFLRKKRFWRSSGNATERRILI